MLRASEDSQFDGQRNNSPYPVLLTHSTSILEVSCPGQAQGAALEISIGEHVGKTEMVIVLLCNITCQYSQYLK